MCDKRRLYQRGPRPDAGVATLESSNAKLQIPRTATGGTLHDRAGRHVGPHDAHTHIHTFHFLSENTRFNRKVDVYWKRKLGNYTITERERERASYVLFHGPFPLFMDGLSVFMDGPICVGVLSGGVAQCAKTFILLAQDCHSCERTTCLEIKAGQLTWTLEVKWPP